MNKKKMLSLVAATMLSISVLAGCGNSDATDNSTLKDGKYEVESKTADERGYKSNLTMEVKDGKIASVNYDEVKEDGTGKKSDADYNKQMKDILGTNPEEAFKTLEDSVIQKQSAEVDAVSNATNSSNAFKKFAAKAIENAQAGTTEKSIIE